MPATARASTPRSLLLRAAAAALALLAPAVPAPAAAEPVSVLVVGDSLARQYCRGLKRHLGRGAAFEVDCEVHPSSGLTRIDFLDWDAVIAERLAEAPAPDVALMAFGANDAQRLVLPDRVLDFGQPAWDEVYGARVDAATARFEAAGAEVIWVGLPIARSPGYAAKLARLNDIYRGRAEAAGAGWLSLWEPTAPGGAYAAALTDASGRSRVAREDDGVHFTRFGENTISCVLVAALPGVADPGDVASGC